jgi:OPA family glycerol-3-phosphate transporter-like MFS transporter
MAMVGLLVLTLLKPGPSGDHDVTHPSAASESRGPVIPAASDRELRAQAQRAVLKSPLLWCYGTSYFFIKFIRYTLLFWLPFYLSKALGYRGDIAAYVSTSFEAGGVVGVIAIGMLSDRLRRRSRAFVAIPTLLALAAVLFGHSVMSSASIAYNVAFFAAVGFALFGPDALISGAASQDAGGPHAAATATGFVNGLGSLGPILVGPVVDGIQKSLGWGALFTALGAMALLSALTLLPVLRRAPRIGA